MLTIRKEIADYETKNVKTIMIFTKIANLDYIFIFIPAKIMLLRHQVTYTHTSSSTPEFYFSNSHLGIKFYNN